MTRKFAGLELLRFLAAAAVLFWHYQHFFYNPATDDPTRFAVTGQPLYPLLALLYRHGDFAVQVFWCISGFIFFYRYGAAIHERRVTLRQYVVFRVSRLYPLHLLTLLAVLALQLGFSRVNDSGARFVYQAFDARHFFLNVLMLSQWGYQKGLSFNGPVWSVSVEEFCYLSFFLLASAVAFDRRSLTALLVASWVILSSNVFSPDFAECIALFLVGGVISGVHGRMAPGGRALRAGAVAALLAAAVVGVALHEPLRQLHPVLRKTLTHYLLVPALLFAFLSLWPDERTRAARIAGELGKLTYSIYMVHFPVQLAAVIAVDALGLKRSVFYSVPALAAFIAAVLGLGYVLHWRFEMPMQAYLRSRLLPARPAVRPEVEPMANAAG